MPSSGRWTWAVALLLAATGFAVTRLFEVSTRGGEAFPEYSTLRSDPMGAKVLHDSLAALPGYRVERSFKPFNQFKPRSAAVVFLLASSAGSNLLGDCRKWAEAGSRIVLVLAPRQKAPTEKPGRENTPVEEEWKLRFEPSSGDRRWTAFKPLDESWRVLRQTGTGGEATVVEKRFGGTGSLVLAGETILISNEGLYRDRNSELLLTLFDGRRVVIFEESHLGVVQSGSVGQLLRRYRLGGAALVLVMLFALFFWRSAVSFLPHQQRTDASAASVTSHAGQDALVNLVRASVPSAALTTAAQILWHRSSRLMKTWSPPRRERVARLLEEAAGPPLETWRRAHEILKRKAT